MKKHSKSNTVVVRIDPKLKRRLYSSLALNDSTLKDWFVQSAENYCHESQLSKPEYSSQNTPVFARETHGHYVAKKNSCLDRRFSVVSMFSGCGGMDLGFQGGFEILGHAYPLLPFDIIWANDYNEEACRTYLYNLRHYIHHGDIRQLIGTMPQKADVLIGGFPCQDISINGKRAGLDGHKSSLYRSMVEAIDRIRPRVFVAENVGALLRHQEWLNQVVSDFKDLGYNLHYQNYQAADYGVPQTRERVFFVGLAPGVTPFVPPAPVRNATTWVNAKEALNDLENLPRLPQINHIWSLANRSAEQGNRKLKEDRPGYTVRAECHGNIQFHYSLPRRISMREAARLQSFPDNFLFVSGLRETERQIGNAVPPVLAWHVAQAVVKCLSTSEKDNLTASNQPRMNRLSLTKT